MENESQIEPTKDCCENAIEKIKSCCKNPKHILALIGMLLLTAIVVVSIIRDRIVNPNENQVTVNGEGRVSYQPDVANVTLGVQIDKAKTAEEAMKLLNEKMNGIVSAIKATGVADEDIKTKNFSLSPQYDFKDGTSVISGYGANQQLTIKAKNIDKNPELASQVIAAANGAGANQVLDVNFEVSNLNDLKQQARIKAIEDARSKAGALAKAAGIRKVKKVVSWYENMIQSPDAPIYYGYGGLGAVDSKEALSSSRPAAPQIPSGSQEIVVNMGVNFEVK